MTPEHKIRKYRPKVDDVEAVRFGGWVNAEEVTVWGQGKIFYVPRGHEHRLRLQREHDRSNGHLLADAPHFLVVRGPGGSLGERADVGDWIVRLTGDPDESEEPYAEYQVVSDSDFRESHRNEAERNSLLGALNSFWEHLGEGYEKNDWRAEYNALAEAVGLEERK